MRILYYFYELDTPMYQWQRDHIIDELSLKGWIIDTFNPASYPDFDIANEALITYMESVKPYDLFMSCDETKILYPATVSFLKKKFSIPTLLICWDNLELPYKQKKLAKEFDLVWLTSQETEYLFKRWGCHTVFQTYAANPYKYHYLKSDLIRELGFIGSPYGSRTNIINDFTQNNIICNIYSDSLFRKNYNTAVGEKKIDIMDICIKASRYMRFPIGWKVLFSTLWNKVRADSKLAENAYLKKHPSVDDKTMNQLYSNFTVSLNITDLRDTYILKTPIHKIHLRAFEIPMCGGLQMASYVPELADYFEDEHEIVFYKSKEEMVDKAKFYLEPKRDNLVERMKLKARKRAESEHTWSIRFTKIFEMLNLK